MYRDGNSIYCSYIVPHPFCFRVKGKTQLSDQPSYLLNCNVSKKYKDYPNLKETIRESNISISQGHLVCLCEQINVASISYTLFLWDINEQKNCQSFQCGFSYLDSLSNALTTSILYSNDWFRICLLNSTANPAHFHQTWAELAALFSRQILNRSIESKNSYCQGIR